MPRKGKTSTRATVQDAAGVDSGRSSPSAGVASSSFPSPSQPSEYESSPEKAPREKSRRLVVVGGSREASQPIHAGPLGSFALLSRARGPTNKIPLIDGASDAAKVNTMAPNSSAAPARKAPSGASHAQKMSASVATHAEDLPGDDQQTQDLEGQEAAPDMHFEVSIRTSREHAHMILCACTCTSNG